MLELVLALALSQAPAYAPGTGICPSGQYVRAINVRAPPTCATPAGGGGGAPTTVPYWTGAADATLSAERNLGALGTGLVLNTAGVPSIYAGGACTGANLVQSLSASGAPTCFQLRLDQLANPTADIQWTFTGEKVLWDFQDPVDAGFSIHGTEAFLGELLHVHQHSGNPGAGTDLVHLEATDADVTGLRISMASSAHQAATITGAVGVTGTLTATQFSGPLAGQATTAAALAADPANCGAGQAPLGVTASGAVESCFTPAGTYTLPDAAAGTTGGVRLTGDLGGTATAPTVVDDSHAHTTTTISALDAGDITTGTLAGARGGGGSALPTCGGTDKLTANGTTWSCAVDVGGTYTLPAAAASVLGGVRGTGALLVCSGTDKATGFDASGTLQCGADQTGGAGSANAVEVDVDFGATESDDLASTVVTGQAWVTATSKVVCAPTMLATSSREEGMEDAVIEGLTAAVHTRVASTGFTVTVAATHGTTGVYKLHCTGL